jgi:saccharopine dehydrogenase-like NADP-dependent oxidoreductase
MNILVIGAGGVGASMASIAETRSFFSTFVLADITKSRAEEAIALQNLLQNKLMRVTKKL